MAYTITLLETGESITIENDQRARLMGQLMLTEEDFAAAMNGTHGVYSVKFIPDDIEY